MKNKKALITGCGGFIGSHLADFLLDKNLEIHGTVYNRRENVKHLEGKIKIHQLDIKDRQAVDDLIADVKPDYIFHLAAQSLVMPSWKDPETTYRTNIIGTSNLLEAVRKIGIDPVIVIACSSAEYGVTHDNEIPIKETKEFRPSSPYAVSKIATDKIGYLFWQTYGMKIINVRFFNITGTRKILDASSDFAKAVAEAEAGLEEGVDVGYLESIRDITDVRDAVRAVWLLTEKGEFGDVYNICSGKGQKIGDVLNALISMANKKIIVRQDENKKRPAEDPVFIGDNSKIKALGWEPEISFEKTLEDMLNFWRAKAREEK